MKHELKIYPEFFQAITLGKKTFEVRLNDRNYQCGDVVVLRECESLPNSPHSRPNPKYTGRCMVVEITYIMPGGVFGVLSDYIIFSFRICSSYVYINQS